VSPEGDDTYKAARELVDRERDMARAAPAARVRALIAEGNIQGAATWSLILEHVKALTTPSGEGDLPVVSR
jgi:hypothetical protein